MCKCGGNYKTYKTQDLKERYYTFNLSLDSVNNPNQVCVFAQSDSFSALKYNLNAQKVLKGSCSLLSE